jgi:hypothetical protein
MSRRAKLVVAGATLAAVVVVGGGIAATKALTPKQETQAVIDDAAAQLGVSPDKLSGALKQALKNRVDEAVKAGRLTKAQGDRIKQAIDAGDAPLFGFGPRRFHEHEHFEAHGPFSKGLETAASYLGLTEDKLLSELRGGKSLAQVAKAHGKSADGLVNAMVKQAETKLDQAVKNGRLTEAEKKEMLTGLKARITDLVNGRFPAPRFGRGFHHRDFGFGFKKFDDDGPGAAAPAPAAPGTSF